ncbi:hypothetical protein [Deinococcus arcticus]|uniref:hypothetical protein n=1 Tax=Deinococcus arcticus TaxID=2136176 RepID=UPI001E294C8F|nr:hypothetical protein [Deinococcus arcticus]
MSGDRAVPADIKERSVMRVLLVEDHLPDAVLLEEWLELAGLAWEVMHVETFAPATARWEQGGFDALLLNLDIPDGFGLNLLRHALLRLEASGSPERRATIRMSRA